MPRDFGPPPPPHHRMHSERHRRPKGIKNLPSYFLNQIKGFTSRLFYIISLVWESAPAVLIFMAALLTGLGIFEKIAKHAGAGTLVPITGFANAVVSPAIEFKTEGHVLGIGVKMFTVAGPVILFGTFASVVYGLIYWILGMI